MNNTFLLFLIITVVLLTILARRVRDGYKIENFVNKDGRYIDDEVILKQLQFPSWNKCDKSACCPKSPFILYPSKNFVYKPMKYDNEVEFMYEQQNILDNVGIITPSVLARDLDKNW